MADNKTTIELLYQGVVNDVITSAKEIFMEDGLDEEVAENLKDIWLSKLVATKKTSKVEVKTPAKETPSVPILPVQILIPSAPDDTSMKIIVNVPADLIKNNNLRRILTSDLIKSVVNIPLEQATKLIQQKINNFKPEENIHQVDGISSCNEDDYEKTNQGFVISKEMQSSKQIKRNLLQKLKDNTCQKNYPNTNFLFQGASKKQASFKDLIRILPNATSGELISNNLNITQTDGSNSSSTSADDDSPMQSNEDEFPATGEDEELNSEDDLTETESDLDSENIIVCQYEKVAKTRNHWKFLFKYGIMNINGQDIVFKKASGEGRW